MIVFYSADTNTWWVQSQMSANTRCDRCSLPKVFPRTEILQIDAAKNFMNERSATLQILLVYK